MGAGWWAFATFAYTIVFIIGSVSEQGFGAAEGSAINQILQFNVLEIRNIAGFSVPLPNGSFFAAIGQLMTLDFDMFRGDLNIVRWVALAPLAGSMSFVIVTRLGPILLEAVSTLRRLLPLPF